MTTILNGIIVRNKIARKLAGQISRFRMAPTLAIIQIGNREDSNAYIRVKKLFAEKIGATALHIHFPESVSESSVIKKIKGLNSDKKVNGIIVQLPIPKSISRENIIEAINPLKDVDGLTSSNVSKLSRNSEPRFTPATALGVMSLLNYYKIKVAKKHIVVIGRSALVGKPLATLLLNHDATVTICHSKTKNLAVFTKQADILVVAAGVSKLIGKKHINKSQIVIDVGINVAEKKLEDEISCQRLVGDVDFNAVKNIVGAISPVPGGVGPMTVASLFENLFEATKNQQTARK